MTDFCDSVRSVLLSEDVGNDIESLFDMDLPDSSIEPVFGLIGEWHVVIPAENVTGRNRVESLVTTDRSA